MTLASDFKTKLEEALEQVGGSLASLDDTLASGSWREWRAVDEGLLSEDQLLNIYGEAYGLSIIEGVNAGSVAGEFVAHIPIDYARQTCMIGLGGEEPGNLRLVVSNPHHIEAIDDVRRLTGLEVEVVLTRREEILEAINSAYEQQATVVDEVVEQWDVAQVDEQLESMEAADDLLEMGHRAPVIKLVNAILFDAIRHKASDIHIQPEEKEVQVRFRVDGVLYDRVPIPTHLLAPIVSRIKIMGRMNVSERRLPQDGRCTARIGSRVVDLRISSIPCALGERVVLRLLDKSAALFTLEQLGMDEATLRSYESMLLASHGIILLTGPTGSGKTTTLYGSLQRLESKESNILTLEDPIEYQLDGISQMQVNPKKGVTFASGLRYLLRQDPDIIMIGEIRDEETARMAVQASLTGHLVFATLHTNDAAGAVTRMMDLGVEPYLVASSLIGVMGQRLVRRLCPNCARPYSPDEAEQRELEPALAGQEHIQLHEEVGCGQCLQRGFSGRQGIFELLPIDGRIRDLISKQSEGAMIRQVATERGYDSLRVAGLRRALEGTTTLREVLRVTLAEEA